MDSSMSISVFALACESFGTDGVFVDGGGVVKMVGWVRLAMLSVCVFQGEKYVV